jgi:hypothetical protein
MALVPAGLDVYLPEVDDRAIDALVRVPGDPPRYFDMQVKTIRAIKPPPMSTFENAILAFEKQLPCPCSNPHLLEYQRASHGY